MVRNDGNKGSVSRKLHQMNHVNYLVALYLILLSKAPVSMNDITPTPGVQVCCILLTIECNHSQIISNMNSDGDGVD